VKWGRADKLVTELKNSKKWFDLLKKGCQRGKARNKAMVPRWKKGVEKKTHDSITNHLPDLSKHLATLSHQRTKR